MGITSLHSPYKIFIVYSFFVYFIFSFQFYIDSVREVTVEIECQNYPEARGSRSKRSLRRLKVYPGSTNVSKRWSEKFHPEVLNIDENTLFVEEEEEVLGIITMEDVIDQLLKVWQAFVSKYVL